jgi:hypothetical protein
MKLQAIFIFVCVLAASGSAAVPAPSNDASLFDKPLRVIHVPLPRDRDNRDAKPEVRCTYYPGFMVKEIDTGEVGSDQLSILRGEDSLCRKANAANEKVVSSDDWTGYFKGYYRGYVFFDADDGWNGGVGFAVFTLDAKKLFEDVAKKWDMVSAVAVPAPAGIPSGRALVLRYTRIYGAKCSLAGKDGAGCWEKIKRDTGLSGEAPDCRELYAREQRRTPNIPVLEDPTAIEYEAATTLAFNGVHVTAVGTRRPSCTPQE